MIAQDFQAVNSGRKAFYKNQSGNVKYIQIDSAKFQVDSIYYLFSNIQQLDFVCNTPYGDSCWSNCCADGCFPAYQYIKGLGGPYYECSNAFSLGGMENKLVYF